MKHILPDLPYSLDALAPFVSAETLEYHHGKHHRAYVDNLNRLIQGGEFENLKLEDIIMQASGGIFNNAAQVWNHSFYWKCLGPAGGNPPGSVLIAAINEAFGSFDAFKKAFTETAVTTFGSGWAWLVNDAEGALKVESTSNAETPLKAGKIPLLTCDVWEHAYYIDYRNARPEYIEAFWNLVNWDFVSRNMGA